MGGIVITGAAWERIDQAWPDPHAVHDDPDVVCGALVSSVEWAVGVARRAWTGSGCDLLDRTRSGCTLGTLYGNDFVSEYVAGALAARGPRWLHPEAFGYAAPHATTAAICIELGLWGPAFTLVGPVGGLAAVASAAATLTLGQHDAVLCGTYDWPSALGGRLYRALGLPFVAGRRGAAFLVLESQAHAAARGARPLGHVLGWAATGGLARAAQRALRRANIADDASWDLLDVGADRSEVHEAWRIDDRPAHHLAPPERDPSPVVGPVLSLASALTAPPTTQRPAVVSAVAPTGPAVALVYRR